MDVVLRVHHLLRAGAALLLLCAVVSLSGCSHERPASTGIARLLPSEPGIVVRADVAWTNTGLHIAAGEAVTVEAGGLIAFRSPEQWNEETAPEVDPAGTYHYTDDVARARFPLPAAAAGPAPCYCLIGRIGDGPPFYVGRARSWIADRSGVLQLGINDCDLTDNCGAFHARVSKPGGLQPVRMQHDIADAGACGAPLPGCSVVIFYVDGLRPDVVQEMAAMGHIPNINRLFLEGGAWPSRTFTAFPSDTITSNGTMWTGCFSDRHGIKGQVRFSRRTLDSESYLEPLGPNRSSRLVAPQGADAVLHDVEVAGVRFLHGEEAARAWDATYRTGVPALYQYLRACGKDWATGALPMMTDLPPVLWSRSLVRSMPYLHAHEAWKYIDDANTHFAQWHLLPTRPAVTIIWLPETDSVSHKQSRGQFGMTRRTIARADEMIGRIARQLQDEGRLAETYLMLVSDHGHHGGQATHLTHFDIADEFFFKPREVSPEGTWIGGGLGMSVRQHRFWNRHPEDDSTNFVFIDGDSDGAARIYLPRRHFRSGDWMGPARPGDLLAYRIDEKHPPINLVAALTEATATDGRGCVCRPVDLVLLKLDDCSILVSTADRGHAVIDRMADPSGSWVYRYTVVENLARTADGGICYQSVESPHIDPLGLLSCLSAEQLAGYYDERTWLHLTAELTYPDSVVTLTRHMLWQEHLRYREAEFAPDLVVTAKPGWYFGIEATSGSNHGYPLADAMRATLFITGPNIRRGACIAEPARLADLTPTILEMTGTPFDPADFDGRPLRGIYQPCAAPLPTPPCAAQSTEACYEDCGPPRPVFWQDLDLQGWGPLCYRPLEKSPYVPWTIHRPGCALDLNNIVYNALTITDVSVLRLMDDVLSPLSHDDQAVTRTVESIDLQLRQASRDWLAQAVHVLDVSGATVADYQFTSTGNIKRADRAIDWVQQRAENLERRIEDKAGGSREPVRGPVHHAVDATQAVAWDLYRFAHRVVMRALDETLLNGFENCTDRAVNSLHKVPAEVVVEPAR